MSSSSEKLATHCGGCGTLLPWSWLGPRSTALLRFKSADIKDLCWRCALNYRYRTGALGDGGRPLTDFVPNPNSPFPFVRAAAAAAAAAEKKKKQPPVAAEKKNVTPGRCVACRKKVGLLGFACRCGGAFCAAHRHAESHGCGFDYKEFGRKRIARENPVVVAPKLAKISTATGN